MSPVLLPKPCLVLGTGFHRWVLGDSMADKHKPLWSWQHLIAETAAELGVALDMPRDEDNLALHWEHLLTTAQADQLTGAYQPTGKVKPQTHDYEAKAKMAAVQVIKRHQASYPNHSRRAQLPIDDCWGAVISLNFDSHWFPTNAKWSLSTAGLERVVALKGNVNDRENTRLNQFIRRGQGGQRVWFPNGHVSQADSLRLGFRDFGFQPMAIYKAFVALKTYERKWKSATNNKSQERDVWLAGVAALDGHEEPIQRDGLNLPFNWVTEMLYRPVVFAGVGLSSAETGLWWLMVQRARNLANIDKAERPKAYILVSEKDKRLDFWRTHPCGIEPVVCSQWHEGWREVERIAKSLC